MSARAHCTVYLCDLLHSCIADPLGMCPRSALNYCKDSKAGILGHSHKRSFSGRHNACSQGRTAKDRHLWTSEGMQRQNKLLHSACHPDS